MAKQLLKERFQELAGIKPLYENEASQVLKVTSERGAEVLITDPEDIKAFLAGEEVYGEDSQGGDIGVSLDDAQDHEITEEAFGAAGTDKRTAQVIGDILQLIRRSGDATLAMVVMEEIGKEFKIKGCVGEFEFNGGAPDPNSGLPKMDPDNWGFKNQ
jgi:hypothetical protein